MFERHKNNPLESIKIGVVANSVKIESIIYGSDTPTYENIKKILSAYDNGSALKWSAGTRNFFETKWMFESGDRDWKSSAYYKLIDFSGKRIEFKGKYYKIPIL
jgi:hypothetical protein